VADPKFGCVKMGSLEINKFGIIYILQILFNPSGGRGSIPYIPEFEQPCLIEISAHRILENAILLFIWALSTFEIRNLAVRDIDNVNLHPLL